MTTAQYSKKFVGWWSQDFKGNGKADELETGINGDNNQSSENAENGNYETWEGKQKDIYPT